MNKALNDLLLERIRRQPGVIQRELLTSFAKRGKASPNTVRKLLANLEKEKKIRSHRRGKVVEYTSIDEMETADLDRALNRTLDKYEEYLKRIRQNVPAYRYVSKHSLYDALDWYLDRLYEKEKEIEHVWYDRSPHFRADQDEINALLERLDDDSDCQVKRDLEGVSLRIAVLLGSKNEDYVCKMENYFRIKFRDRKQTATIYQHMDELNEEMNDLEKDFHEICDALKKKVEFGRADIDLCPIADRLCSKYGVGRVRKRRS